MPDRLENVVVLIPALNEQQSIGEVLRRLPPVGAVIVADNGSTDRTAEVAHEAGAQVVTEPRRGYGSACLAGITAIDSVDLAQPAIVVFLDADLSDSPEMLTDLVAPILCDEQDMVLGSRMLGEREPGAMPPQAVFGNHLACWLMRLCFGAQYTDLGPFRAIRLESLRQLGMQDRDFGWTIEMQIKAHRAGLRTIEIPVPYRCRVGESKISGTVVGSVKAGVKILWTIAKYGLSRSSRQTAEVAS